jgi:ferric-dicitrate binding protein FerR (iron transport regulator)
VGIWSREGQLMQEKGIADNENYFSWMKDGGLGFDGTPLVQVITQLKRIYGRRIVLDNPAMLARKITLQYPKSDLETILQVIAKTMKTTIVHTGDVYHIQ